MSAAQLEAALQKAEAAREQLRAALHDVVIHFPTPEELVDVDGDDEIENTTPILIREVCRWNAALADPPPGGTTPEHRCGVRGFADSGDECPGCKAANRHPTSEKGSADGE